MMLSVKLHSGKLSSLPVRFALLPVLLASLLLPTAARAQVSFTGVTPSVNFGSQAIGSPSAAQTLSFSISSATTVGSIAVLTMGAPNLDFANAAGSTCTATAFSSPTNCTVNVTFTPTAAGLRMGAVLFFSGAGNTGTVLANAPIYGIGTGPQIAFNPAPIISIPILVGENDFLPDPLATAVDGAGDLFIADYSNNRILQVPAGGGVPMVIDPTVNGKSLYGPTGVALDGAGDLFIADALNNRVVEAPAGGGAAIAIAPTVNGIGLNVPACVTSDTAGNLYIADRNNNRVVQIPAGGGTPIAIAPTVNGKGLSFPNGVALDVAGTLFIADIENNRVVEVPARGGAAIAIAPVVNGKGLNGPVAVALDGAGDLYIGDRLNYRVVEVPAGGGAATAISPVDVYIYPPYGVTVDDAGNLFIATYNNSKVLEVERAQPPTLSLAASGILGTTNATKTAQVQNIGNQALNITGVSYPDDFPEVGGDANVCTGSTSLSAGQQCDVSVRYTSQSSGVLSEEVTLTDNALNVSGAQQSIPVAGSGQVLAQLISPAPGSVLPGSSVTFTWSSGTGVAGYQLLLGTTGVGSYDLYHGVGKLGLYGDGETTATSVTVSVPTNGVTVYARLCSYINGEVQLPTIDYTYTEAGATVLAAISSPGKGSVLTGSSVPFMWSTGSGPTAYQLWMSETWIGGHDLYDSGITTATMETVPVPTNGVTLYVRLSQRIDGLWQATDYTYTEAGTPAQAKINYPTKGSVLPGTSVPFTWSAGSGATAYRFLLGTTGIGSYDLYDSGKTTATTETVGVPANGVTVYARILSCIDRVWLSTDYTYTEAGTPVPAAMTYPTKGSVLTGSSVTFTWSSGSGPAAYQLLVGTAGVGSYNLYQSGVTTATDETVNNLPTNGIKVYVRLFSYINKQWQSTDYTYTAQ